MTDRKPRPELPREQVDLEKAFAAPRKPPDGQRFERGKDRLPTSVGQRLELNSVGADGAQTSVFDFSRNRDQLCPVDDDFAEYALNRNRHLFPTPEGWNDALWREHFITNRIRRLIHGGFWPPPIGWCTDLLSDGAYELPRQDFIESRKPRRPQLAVVNGQRV